MSDTNYIVHETFGFNERLIQAYINKLNQASYAYYNSDSPIMSDEEYDYYLEELQRLEKETGIIFSGSPTQVVGASVLPELKKVPITPKPMLSLDKCHSYEEVADFAGAHSMIAMVKLDGLSVRIKYNNGKMISANTRGNGVEGTDITEHIKQFQNVPLEIPEKGEFIIDGEAIIKIKDFEEINKNNAFKNPRNAAAGALNVLDTKLVKDRKLSFIAWDVINGDRDLGQRFMTAMRLGFQVVPHQGIAEHEYSSGTYHKTKLSIETIDQITNAIMDFKSKYPCDGVVWKFRDTEYGDSLGQTSHHFKNGIAWKPEVETVETKLKFIDWTMGRTGTLTPVAVFEPVELDGSTIERASLHNYSVMRKTLGDCAYVGENLTIFKANLIIPQILEAGPFYNYGEVVAAGGVSAHDELEYCPVCHGKVELVTSADGVTNYVCMNPNCQGKLVNRLDHFCGKKGLDIKGLSKATLEKLIDWGWIEKISDLYNLKSCRNEWALRPGFGVKSVDKILAAIEESKQTDLESFISAIGIPLIGRNVAKEICKHVDSYDEFRQLIKDNFKFYQWDSFGPEKSESLLTYNYEDADYISTLITFKKEIVVSTISKSLENITVCITGKLYNYKNRASLQKDIEDRGGKVSSSVSSKTNYLINNDNTSTSSKNLTAQKLGIKILTEEEFIQKFLH